jgi:hypothetical protein
MDIFLYIEKELNSCGQNSDTLYLPEQLSADFQAHMLFLSFVTLLRDGIYFSCPFSLDRT